MHFYTHNATEVGQTHVPVVRLLRGAQEGVAPHSPIVGASLWEDCKWSVRDSSGHHFKSCTSMFCYHLLLLVEVKVKNQTWKH